MAKRIHVRHRLGHVRPHLLQLRLISGVPIVLGHQINEFAVAVILRHRRGAVLVDAARHLAILVLVRSIPVDKILDVLVVAESQQRGRRQRAVTDPRARVAARARLDRGAIAIDENVRELRAHRLRVPRSRGRKRDAHRSHLLAPFARGLLELRRNCALALAREKRDTGSVDAGRFRSRTRLWGNYCGRLSHVPASGRREQLREVQIATVQRHREVDRTRRRVRTQLELIRERSGGVAVWIGDGDGCGDLSGA